MIEVSLTDFFDFCEFVTKFEFGSLGYVYKFIWFPFFESKSYSRG